MHCRFIAVISSVFFSVLFPTGCSYIPEQVTNKEPSSATLKVNKPEITLNYLQRDTLMVLDTNQDEISWRIIEGESCISMIGNIVIGRRKGVAKIPASIGDEFGIVTVNVANEKYIPVKELIVDINGNCYKTGSIKYIDNNTYGYDSQQYAFATGDTVWVQAAEKLRVKVVGYEPSNATHPVAAISSFLADNRGSMGYNGGPAMKLANPLWYKRYVFDSVYMANSLKESNIDSIIFSGNVTNLSEIIYRVSLSQSYINIYRVFIEDWPKDINKTAFDINEMERAFKAEQWGNKSDLTNFEYKLYIDVVPNSVEIKGDNGNCIYLHTGEKRQLSYNAIMPEEFNKPYNWYWLNGSVKSKYWRDNTLTNIYFTNSNILLDKDGIISLSPNYLSNMQGKQNDTIFMGNVSIVFTPTDTDAYSKLIQDPWFIDKWGTPGGDWLRYYFGNGDTNEACFCYDDISIYHIL